MVPDTCHPQLFVYGPSGVLRGPLFWLSLAMALPSCGKGQIIPTTVKGEAMASIEDPEDRIAVERLQSADGSYANRQTASAFPVSGACITKSASLRVSVAATGDSKTFKCDPATGEFSGVIDISGAPDGSVLVKVEYLSAQLQPMYVTSLTINKLTAELPAFNIPSLSQSQSMASFTAVAGAVSYQVKVVPVGGSIAAIETNVTTNSVNISALTSGVTYHVFISAIDAAGNLSPATNSGTMTWTPIFLTPPGAPTGISGTPANQQVALTWTAPGNNGGSAITDYLVQYSSDAGSNWTAFNDGTSATASATVTGLVNGTAYIFRVAAVNGTGTSDFSASSTNVTPASGSSAPSAPSAPSGTPANQQVALTWTAPGNNGGSAITDYLVQYSSDSGSNWTVFNDGTSATAGATVTGLTNGTSYIFRVAAVNSVGTGAYGVSSTAITPACPITILSQPASSVASAGAAGFVVGAVSPGVTLSYQWQKSDTSGGATFTNISGTTQKVLSLTGLTTSDDGFNYRVVVSASCSPTSVTSNATSVRVYSVPSAVTGVAGSSEVALFWAAPSGGGPVTDYAYSYSSDGGATWSSSTLTGSSNPYWRVTGLSPGISYQFVVAAVQNGTTGTQSEPSALIVTGANGTVTACAGDCYLEGGSPLFAQGLATGTERAGPGGAILTLEYADGASGFKIWKEKNGSRILSASGFPGAGWQRSLSRTGTDFSNSDFVSGTNIAGRVCPAHVFLNHASESTMKASGRCLYYDAGNAATSLDGASSTGTGGEDWLKWWNANGGATFSEFTGRAGASSYYEGNVKTCADKGMRLPVIYETSSDKPGNTYLPTGDALTSDPVWAGAANGVPSTNSWTWTASATSAYGWNYWAWSGLNYSSGNNSAFGFDMAYPVRCVLPAYLPAQSCSNSVSADRPDDCYNEGVSPNYAQDLPIGTKRRGPGDVTISLQFANGSSGVKIWKEDGGNRILNAAGLISNGWQKKLTRAGTAFLSTDFTTASNIAGRACPKHVFRDHNNMTSTGKCLYYDSGSNVQRLDAAHPSQGGAAESVEAEDWLLHWDRAGTGRGILDSYYEGNIKTCADRGMRLPVLYETTSYRPDFRPTGDVGWSPVFRGESGAESSSFVPAPTSFTMSHTWTASASRVDNRQYSIWSTNSPTLANRASGTYANGMWTNGIYSVVRCVIPD